MISRDPTTNIIQRILNVQTNAGGAETRGVDLEVQYKAEPNFFASQEESFSVRALAGFLGERSTTSAAGAYINFVRRISTPEYTGIITLNYKVADIGIMLQGTYYDKTLSNGNNEALATNWIEGVDVDNNHVASQTLVNFGLTYGKQTTAGHDWQVSFNINNLLNRDPPIIATTGGQFLSNSHDQFGRRYQLGLNYSF